MSIISDGRNDALPTPSHGTEKRGDGPKTNSRFPSNLKEPDGPRDAAKATGTGFSFAEARTLIGDLSRPNPTVYWTDFLLSVFGGHTAFVVMFLAPQLHPGHVATPFVVLGAYLVTIILYMRAAMFIHELVHLPKDGFRLFRIAWNGLFGCFFMVPSFLYYPHVDHHRRKHYGTKHDGEYLSLSHSSPWLIIGFVVQALIIPFLAIARFLLISPLCWIAKPIRRYIHRHASTMLVDPSYERTDASPKLMRMVVFQEICCFVIAFTLVFGYRLVFGEWISPLWIPVYTVAVGVIVINEVRTLGSHRWRHTGEEMSFQEQLLDSVNYPHCPWISELWGPIGTRYHALHHLFPRLPYHNLGKAHRRLVEGLPADSPYHETIAPSLTSEVVALWRRASSRGRST